MIPTMMDYYTVVIGPGTFDYSISYGYDMNPFPAICQYGNYSLLANVIIYDCYCQN